MSHKLFTTDSAFISSHIREPDHPTRPTKFSNPKKLTNLTSALLRRSLHNVGGNCRRQTGGKRGTKRAEQVLGGLKQGKIVKNID